MFSFLDYAVYGPPEDSFLSDNAFRTGTCDGIVLAGKPAYEKIVFGNLIQYSIDVCVYLGTLGKMRVVASECKLLLYSPWLPLIGPDCLIKVFGCGF